MKFFVIFAFFTYMIFVASLGEKSDYYIRKKRIVDNTPPGESSVSNQEVPYMVHIRRNEFGWCGGSILSPHVVITAAHCFIEKGIYSILSNSTERAYGLHHVRHQITKIIIYPEFRASNRFEDDLALLIVRPPINVYNSLNREIKLYDEPVPPNTLGTLSGWGCTSASGPDKYPRTLRSITMPISEKCKSFFDRFLKNVDKEICTHDDLGQKCSGSGDSGGPLVVNGQLAGILSYRNRFKSSVYFMKLSYPKYKSWILSNIPSSDFPISPVGNIVN